MIVDHTAAEGTFILVVSDLSFLAQNINYIICVNLVNLVSY